MTPNTQKIVDRAQRILDQAKRRVHTIEMLRRRVNDLEREHQHLLDQVICLLEDVERTTEVEYLLKSLGTARS